MLRNFGYGFLSLGIFFSADTFANTYNLAPNLTIEYELPPNSPQTFSNSFFWTITAECIIHSQDAASPLLIKGLKKKGTVNGTRISQGDSLVLTVHDKDKLKISADSGAEVALTNQGVHSIKAVCKT
ncbi:hypothetical protein [Legionella spiritensis]|uniref:Uncharacterized protein n=1 Tax=Legionella spiritensis TaxID=452 RepID=A0A0W0Z918_LEGSP|nr:hypothetical protein [Legionella spiritensis]KTD65519.1 hypothetical protein Lspi_0593 [Legionella spiritensis]SNV36107.1 Uncharacterised protein [Legionella spiritensis]VEG89905.1 Uncharacterised protein [Legionella spiritensis]